MMVLTGVLCSTAVHITCLHNLGTIRGKRMQDVFIADRKLMLVLCTCYKCLIIF